MTNTKNFATVHQSVCHTQLRVVQFAQKWAIDLFSTRCTNKNDKANFPSIMSSEFSPAHCEQPKFYLQLYPKGRNEECKDCVSVFVFLKSCDENELNAKCNISIVNAKGEKCKTWETEYEFIRGGQGWGKPKFVAHAHLLNPINKLLPDDRLTLYCELRTRKPRLALVNNSE